MSTRCCSYSLRTATMAHPATLPNLDHAHTHTHTHTTRHTHRNPMGSQCFMALTATCGSFTHAMPPTPTAIPATRGGTRRHTAAHSMPCHTAHAHSDPGDPRQAHGGTRAMPPPHSDPGDPRRHTADSLRQRTVTSPRRPRWPTAGPQLESLGTNACRATHVPGTNADPPLPRPFRHTRSRSFVSGRRQVQWFERPNRACASHMHESIWHLNLSHLGCDACVHLAWPLRFLILASWQHVRLLEPVAPRTSGVNYSSVVHSISETWRPAWEVLGNSSAPPRGCKTPDATEQLYQPCTMAASKRTALQRWQLRLLAVQLRD